jgi:hypothetical protein
MSLAYAVESWILAILGWAVLTVQEMWAWSLLSAHVFYSMLCLSTCHVLITALWPDSKKPKQAYFATVLCIGIHTLGCVFDAVQPIEIGKGAFVSPSGSNCTLRRVNQVHFFTDSLFYMIQAGNTLAYLLVHLLLAGAPVLDAETRTLWPGNTWGNSLSCLLCMRFAIMFDNTAKGVREVDDQFYYFMFFSEPMQALEMVFLIFFLFFLTLLALRGCGFLRPLDHWYILLINGGGTLVFVVTAFSIMFDRSLLTLQMLVITLVPLIPAVYGVMEALLPSYFTRHAVVTADMIESARSRPPPPYVPRDPRPYIPIPIQVDAEKNKGV